MLTIFYDGQCGLCHWTIRFLIRRDPRGQLFRYAALQGLTAKEHLPSIENRPDSVAVLTQNHSLLVRGDAAIKVGKTLGGIWWFFACCFSCLPRTVRDGLYDLVARYRYRIFGTKNDVCPMIDSEQTDFFLP